ncbi:MAG TPA: MFS transporter [Acidimicrobiales bacterium]|nr:MFS transporter [Acidimicrobiales bacterium]
MEADAGTGPHVRVPVPGPARTSGAIDRRVVWVMAVATGLSVASNYYAQPLLPAMEHTLHLAPGTAGLVVTVAQVGYALGLAFLLPLGDLVERRRLVALLSVGTAGALLWLGLAPSAAVLLPAALVVGALSVLAQVLVPFAASLAGEHERGRVVGSVMSGLLVGVLLARTVAGLLAATGTWRVVYLVAAGAMLVQAAVLRSNLPTWHERPGLSYPALVRSVVRLLAEEPVLRLRAAYGLCSFGTFSALWTSMAFLLAHHYHYGTAVIGLFGLIGAAGALAASVAGRLSDRGLSNRSTALTTLLLVASWALLWDGSSDLALFVVGIVVLDVGAQGLHITNQGEIYRLRPEARSRLTAAYMVLYFVGGAIGSVSSAVVYGAVGWSGVCAVGAAFALAAFALWAFTALRARPRIP